MTTKQDHYVLFTNLEYVWVANVRTHCAALVLENTRLGSQLRGFGYDPAWPVFDVRASAAQWVNMATESSAKFIGDDGVPRPLFNGGILEIPGAPEIRFALEDASQSLDVVELSGAPEDRIVLRVWEELRRRIELYYTKPALPLLSYRTAVNEVRRTRGDAAADGYAAALREQRR